MHRYLALLWFALAGCDAATRGGDHNGFDISNASIPVAEILHGGPGRDGIPALTAPAYIAADAADELMDDEDRVLGLVIGEQARAYPIKIMNWHEIVNDQVDGRPVLVSYCPLCGSGMAFDPRIGGKALSFGVSGLLYNSDVLMYDHQSESLWSQLMATAISGPMRGRQLRQYPLQLMRWKHWRQRHPATLVLSRDTGHWRDYDRDPYLGYAQSDRTLFPVAQSLPAGWHPKQWVTGIKVNGESRAWPLDELQKHGGEPLREQLGGLELVIRYDVERELVEITDQQGQPLTTVTAYLFAWHAFHPEGSLFRADQAQNNR